MNLTEQTKPDTLSQHMVPTIRRSLLLILLIMTAFNLAGHFVSPESCCSVPANFDNAGDTDCLVCTLQVGVWTPDLVALKPIQLPDLIVKYNPFVPSGFVFIFFHPPIA